MNVYIYIYIYTYIYKSVHTKKHKKRNTNRTKIMTRVHIDKDRLKNIYIKNKVRDKIGSHTTTAQTKTHTYSKKETHTPKPTHEENHMITYTHRDICLYLYKHKLKHE